MEKIKNLDKCVIYFIGIIALMFIGSTYSYLTYISVILCSALAVLIGFESVKIRNYKICSGLLCLLMFQNLCIGLGAHMFHNVNEAMKLITQIPFMSIAIVWIIIEIEMFTNKEWRKNKSWKLFIALLVCMAISFVIGRGSFLSILMNVRNLTTFYMAYTIAKYNIGSKEELNKLIRVIIVLAMIFLFFGVILLITGYEGYDAIGIGEVYIAKGADYSRHGLDGRFYTTLISRQFMRMGSILYEPVNLAYFYAVALILSIFGEWTEDKKKKIAGILLCGIGLLLTFGKGGYLLAALAIGAFILERILKLIFKNTSGKKIFGITIVVIVVATTVFAIAYYKLIGQAVKPHFEGIERTWASVLEQPYGYGLGTGGNMAEVFNKAVDDVQWLEIGGETALMSFMYQLGIQGVIVFVICILSFVCPTDKNDKMYSVFNYMPIILIGIALMQDNTFTPQCIVPYMFVLGALKRISEEEE